MAAGIVAVHRAVIAGIAVVRMVVVVGIGAVHTAVAVVDTVYIEADYMSVAVAYMARSLLVQQEH